MKEPDEFHGWQWRVPIGAVLLAATMGFEGWMAVPERLNAWEIRRGVARIPGRERTYEETKRPGALVTSPVEKRFVLSLITALFAFLGTAMLVSGVRKAYVKTGFSVALAGVGSIVFLGLWGSGTAMALIGLIFPFAGWYYYARVLASRD